jgi:hypothetical protein
MMKDVGDRIEMKAVPVLSPIIETLFLISVFAGLSPSWQRTIRCSSTTTLSTLATEGTSRQGSDRAINRVGPSRWDIYDAETVSPI